MIIGELEWDDENIEHIAQHNVSPQEVEEVCFGQHIAFLGRNRRYILYGKSNGGRHLKVVLERRHGTVFRPITAYDMTDKEKHKYIKLMS